MSREKGKGNDESKLVLIQEHERLMEQLMRIHNVREDLKEDVKSSMVVALLQAYDAYGEAYSCILTEVLCDALADCLKNFSYSGKEYDEEPYYEPFANLDVYTEKVISQAERADKIMAAVNQLVNV